MTSLRLCLTRGLAAAGACGAAALIAMAGVRTATWVLGGVVIAGAAALAGWGLASEAGARGGWEPQREDIMAALSRKPRASGWETALERWDRQAGLAGMVRPRGRKCPPGCTCGRHRSRAG